MGLFSRLSRLVKGFFGLFVSGLEERNPKALLEVAKQEFSERIASANNGLAKMAGVVSRLQMQIKLGTRKATELQDRILANYHAGNAELAGSLARELQDVKNDLTENASELKESEESYQNYLRQVKVFGKEYEEKVRRLENQLSKVDVAEARAAAAQALGNIPFKVGDIGDTMKSVQDIIDKRLSEAEGKARAASDMTNMEEVTAKEGERKALEQAALGDFLASQGIAVEKPEEAMSQATPVPEQKEIGPS